MLPKAALPIHHAPGPSDIPAMDSRKMDEDRHTPPTPPTEHAHTRRPSRPDNTRSSTDPSPSLLLQGYLKEKDLSRPSSSHRNRSPYSRSHLRSRSSGAAAGLPLMTRAHSMPSPPTSKTFGESTPPSNSGTLSPATAAGAQSPALRPTPVRTRSPFKSSTEEGKGWMDGGLGGPGIESIQEDSELDFQPRAAGAQAPLVQPTALHASRVPSAGGRRRPASPLYNQQRAPSPGHATPPAPTSFPATLMDGPTAIHHTSSSASSSPSLGPQQIQQQKYINEAYPSSLPPPAQHHQLRHHSSHSSITSLSSYPSTPTSARSRSPSISSLDTIEDEPEREAIESLKAAAEGEEEGERRRSSLDGPRPTVGFGFTRGRSERKRWSVCGGERRGDLDLETIWED